MTYAIAAAGTGGHVFPGLAIAEALERLGVERDDIVFFGGDRFEVEAVPVAGYDLVSVPLQGLKRSFSSSNLKIPLTVRSAVRAIAAEMRSRNVMAAIGTGGYVTVPAALAARSADTAFFIQEQNAHAGLANRLMARFAQEAFTSFPDTEGLPKGAFVGNPLRSSFVSFNRSQLRETAYDYYGLDPMVPTLGVVGGSLGAGVLNKAVAKLVRNWDGPRLQIVHLAGRIHADEVRAEPNPQGIVWNVVPFETLMERFFAVTDIVLARAGGMVAEITATGTPSILIPGSFGSKGHQAASAEHVERSGAGFVVEEANIDTASSLVRRLIIDTDERREHGGGSCRNRAPKSRGCHRRTVGAGS